jgi:hypothetical protein
MAKFIEFAPHHKTVRPKPGVSNAAVGTFWYAEGWIGDKRFEFAVQESREDAEELCFRLNIVVEAFLAALAEGGE